ncbi:MAG: hypothetical protein OXT71_11200 [Acidobacteriota bacterium]|nr:hypothetical protein [Acidobacteriota bacterium]
MKKSIQFLSVALLSVNLVVPNSTGTRPLSNVRKYPVSVEKDAYSLGARLLSEKEVLQNFVTPLKDQYVVVEVGMYPGINDIEVDNRDFVLRIDGFDRSFRPQEPSRIAIGQQRTTTKPKRQVGIVPYGNIEYERGRGHYPDHRRFPRRSDRRDVDDPDWDRRDRDRNRGYGGLRTVVGVGVVLDRQPQPSSDQDRYVMETELHDKSLPQGFVGSPVAGHLYFAVGEYKKKAKHRLEYRGNGESVTVVLPAK